MTTFTLSPAVHEAFARFLDDGSSFALPLVLTAEALEPLSFVYPKSTKSSFHNALSELEAVLDPWTALYLLLRHNDLLVAITFAPYFAQELHRSFFLENRQELVRQLGEHYFSLSLICKEIGEITDARSWEERSMNGELRDAIAPEKDGCGTCQDRDCKAKGVNDIGYQKNKCRLCDRRMKNKISPEALSALKTLDTSESAVQISVNISTETLTLTFAKTNIASQNIAATLPIDKPSFTFYRHPITQLLYFIFHSPDSATVQERMKHTMAIPGLVNVHAEEQGLHIDQKIEIHDPRDLVFEAKDERIGKFRSMYLRNRFEGTESNYKGLEADKESYDGVK